MAAFSPELIGILGIIGVQVLPKLLLRFRIPAPVTALGLGMLVTVAMPALGKDATIAILSTLGISALFLSAGLGVDANELGARPQLLITTLAAHGLLLSTLGVLASLFLHLDVKSAMLVALAVGTPSGGFILDGLAGLRANPSERKSIHDTALVCELLSLVIFFFVMQAGSWLGLLKGTVAIVALLLLVPIVLRVLAKTILPHAPNAEFTLVVLTAVCFAYATRQIGIYYLLGAFAVGIVARRLEKEVPELSTAKNIDAVKLFAAFFAPFYFAHAGMEVDGRSFGLRGVGFALGLVLIVLPIRIGLSTLTRRLTAGETGKTAFRVSSALVPTFVFSLVMAQMLHHTGSPVWVSGGLVLFAVINSFVPQTVFGLVPPEPIPDPKPVAETKAETEAPSETVAVTEAGPVPAPAPAPAPASAPASAPAPAPTPTHE